MGKKETPNNKYLGGSVKINKKTSETETINKNKNAKKKVYYRLRQDIYEVMREDIRRRKGR